MKIGNWNSYCLLKNISGLVSQYSEYNWQGGLPVHFTTIWTEKTTAKMPFMWENWFIMPKQYHVAWSYNDIKVFKVVTGYGRMTKSRGMNI